MIIVNNNGRLVWLLGVATLVGFAACNGPDGKDGSNGTAGTSCTVTDNGDGTKTISCEDGTTATINDGANGADGGTGSCTVTDNNDGTKTINCSDGTSVTVSDGTQGPDGSVGQPGQPGLNAGESPGLVADVAAAAPANGTYYDANERIVLTFTLTDAAGNPLTPDQMATLNLYLSGPRDVLKTKTASALLGANTDRATRPHHYIDLTDTTNPDLTVAGNVLTYTLQPITTEEAGTYTAGLWAVPDGYAQDQTYQLLDIQILTDTVEPKIVDGCGDCHTGSNGVTYLHHIDPGHSPFGNPSLDSVPVDTCKNCHNNEGYAAVRVCDDDGLPPTRDSAGNYNCATGTYSYLPDNIVRRVHGLHNGVNLSSPYNQTDFEDYLELHFPADIRNCVKCHSETEDDWNTQPSRLACGSCHDAIDWATGNFVPPRDEGTCTTNTDCDSPATCNSGTCQTTAHGGGPQTSDSNCSGCHAASAIQGYHAIPAPNFAYTLELSMSAPGNGTHYVDGETPVLTMVVKDAATGNVIDPNTIDETSAGRANIYVSGPRMDTEPVLTTAAEGLAAIRALASNATVGPWDLSAAADFQVKIDGGATITVPVSSGTFANNAAATNTEVAAWLNADTSFSAVATASAVTSRTGATTVTVKSNTRGAGSSVEILASDVQAAMGFTIALSVPVNTEYYAENDFRKHVDSFADDPRITRTTGDLKYQLDDVAGLEPGTYSVWVELGLAPPMSWALLNFQVGTATEEKTVATNCATCHEDTRMHAGYFAVEFNPDICKSCHDYERQQVGKVGWANANNGFGAAPLARRIHGVHRGHYLDKPQEVHATVDYSDVIFPQDIRNCTTCHQETDSWAEEPSRLACLACHDEDSTIAHGTLMTVDMTPADPWSGDELESCETCHGPGAEFSVESVHNVADPYKPPYPR